MEPEQIADVLDDAADYIERNGWTQGPMLLHDTGICALGAMNAVLYGMKGYDAAEHPAAEALLQHLGDEADDCPLPRLRIPLWNDRFMRTEQEVLDAFRAAAKQQRGLA